MPGFEPESRTFVTHFTLTTALTAALQSLGIETVEKLAVECCYIPQHFRCLV